MTTEFFTVPLYINNYNSECTRIKLNEVHEWNGTTECIHTNIMYMHVHKTIYYNDHKQPDRL